MTLPESILELLRLGDLVDQARKNPKERPKVREIMTEAALRGDTNAALYAGNLAGMEPPDPDAQLYWYERAAQCGRPEVLADVSAAAAQAAIDIADRDEKDAGGPATTRALAWVRIYLDAREGTTESEWRQWGAALSATGTCIKDVHEAIANIRSGGHGFALLH